MPRKHCLNKFKINSKKNDEYTFAKNYITFTLNFFDYSGPDTLLHDSRLS